MSAFALNPELDVGPARERLAAATRVHLPGVLACETAEAVGAALRDGRDWNRAVVTASGAFNVPLDGDRPTTDAHRAWLAEARIDGAHGPMQYVYDTRLLSASRLYGQTRGDFLESFEAWLNGPEMIGFISDLTGEARVARCDAQATRFLPGHVLTAHNDWDGRGERLFAFVLNFARPWRADWGGLLLFYGPDGHVSEGFTPLFNSLNLFKAPQPHAVSQVSSFAQGPRLAVSGWFTT